jgi:hypothetical protein
MMAWVSRLVSWITAATYLIPAIVRLIRTIREQKKEADK